MKFEDIKIGMQAIPYCERDKLGIVISIDSAQKNVCLDHFNGQTSLVNFGNLMAYDSEKEKEIILAAQAKINESTLSFAKAFEALQEARSIMNSYQPYYMQLSNDDIFASKELYHIIESNGWQTSSLDC